MMNEVDSRHSDTRPVVFIHTNARQRLGAEVARYALKRNSSAPERFDVRILDTADFPFIAARGGERYLRQGVQTPWLADDLQSFTPLRFAVPAAMGYQGRALLIDPDIFAVGDVNELLERDMAGFALLARPEPARGKSPAHFASSVMLLDCQRLGHWRVESQFRELFDGRRDYRRWMWLLDEPEGSIGPLESVWNDFDRLAPDTRLLHNTERRTQPWKTGLPAEFVTHHKKLGKRAARWLQRTRNVLTGGDAPNGYYEPHPDAAQQNYFFQLVAECLERQVLSREFLEEEMARGHLRRDALTCIDTAIGQPAGLATRSTAQNFVREPTVIDSYRRRAG